MSKIEVNTVEPQCGTTLTLGGSGDTVALGSGASQTGFGRTGTVDWITTPKTNSDSPVTGVSGNGYFLNTTSGTITFNLPAGSAGDIVSLADYASTWQNNAVTLSPNGTDKIGGTNASSSLVTEGQSVTFVYVDGVEGWKNVQDSTSNISGGTSANIVASGGCESTCGNYKIHKFLSPGTFTVTSISATPGNNIVSYMVVAGGASGGTPDGGGGGAGGFREYKGPADSYTASPLNGNGSGGTAVTVTAATPYPIAVGGGGAVIGPAPSVQSKGTNGDVSTFSTITSAGGGGGAAAVSPQPGNKGQDGGSGGGGGRDGVSGNCAGAGNTPPTTPSQGFPGATSPTGGWTGGGGGGGATAAGTGGTGGTYCTEVAGNGGAGATTSISGTPTAYAGGAGASAQGSSPVSAGVGGAGGGGNGSIRGYPGGIAARPSTNGGINTGGGGGGGGSATPGDHPGCSGGGGSGIVIIRYKYQ